MNLTDALTTGEVARRLGVSATRVAQLREKGLLRGRRTPLGFLYAEKDVADIERRRRDRKQGYRDEVADAERCREER